MPKESTQVSKKEQTVDVDDSNDFNFVHINDLDVDKIDFPPIADKLSSDTRYHSFPTYKYGKKTDKITFTTDEIKITKGGIPRLDERFRKNDSKREFFWLGIDKEQAACVSLFDKLKEIDEKYDNLISYDTDNKEDRNVESKTVCLLKDKKKEPLTVLEYTPLVRKSIQGGDGEQKPDQPAYEPYDRIKIKFQKRWDKNKQEGDLSELTTVLFLGDKEEEENLTYPSDFEKYLRWNCTARFVLQVTKFGCKKAITKDKKGKQEPRDCGFDISVLQIYITKEAPTIGSSNADKYRKRLFPKLNTVPTLTTPPVGTLEKKQTKQESSDESSGDSDASDDSNHSKDSVESKSSESSKEVVKQPVKKVVKEPETKKSESKRSKKVDSESESESSESSDNSDSEDSSSEEKSKSTKKSTR
jgi:hypothetical protein